MISLKVLNLYICIFIIWYLMTLCDAVCEDKEGFTLEFNGKSYADCSELASDPEDAERLCVMYGLSGLECCQSCTKMKECLTEDSFSFDTDDGVTLTCADLAQTYPYTYYCNEYSDKCCKNCKDVDTSCQDQPWGVTVLEETLSCAEMVEKYPLLCTEEYLKSECCISCQNAKRECSLNPLKTFTVSGKELNCKAYISDDPGVCDDLEVLTQCCSICEVLSNCKDQRSISVVVGSGTNVDSCSELARDHPYYCKENLYGGTGNTCCLSCLDVDVSCVDADISFVAPDGKTVSTCQLLADSYSYYCKPELYGGEGNKCCKTCKDVDLNCVDDPEAFWRGKIGQKIYCAEAVKDNPAMCLIESDKCCKSCKHVMKCDDKSMVSIKLPTSNRETEMSCTEMARLYPYFCTQAEFYGGLGDCCETCKDTDTSCVDNPTFTLEIAMQTIHCGDVKEQLQFLCKDTRQDVKAQCCQACKNVVEEETVSVPQQQQPATTEGGNDAAVTTLEQETQKPTTKTSTTSTTAIVTEQMVTNPGPQTLPPGCEGEDTYTFQAPDGVMLECADIGRIYPYTYYCIEHGVQCCTNCRNVDVQCQDVPWGVKVNDEDMSCKDLAKQFPLLCGQEYFKDDCCISCKDVDAPACSLNPLKTWDVNGEQVHCKEYIVANPGVCLEEEVKKDCCSICEILPNCKDESVISVIVGFNKRANSCPEIAEDYAFLCREDKYGGEGNKCCLSCHGVDANCADMAITFIAPNGKTVSSCEEMAKFYAYNCATAKYGGPGNRCCKACKSVDISCVDNPDKTWSGPNGEDLHCMEAVLHTPSICIFDKKECCQSCERLMECDDKDEVTVYLPELRTNKKMTCPELAENYPWFCTQKQFYGGLGDCCHSCKQADTTCVDNPEFSLVRRKGVVYCSDVKEKISYCEEEGLTVKTECCKTCSPNTTSGTSTQQVTGPVTSQTETNSATETVTTLGEMTPNTTQAVMTNFTTMAAHTDTTPSLYANATECPEFNNTLNDTSLNCTSAANYETVPSMLHVWQLITISWIIVCNVLC